MAQAKKPGASKQKPIADVAQPGKSAPSPSAKPVIVTNRPLLKDPMVVAEAEENPPLDTEPAEGEAIQVSVNPKREAPEMTAESQPPEESSPPSDDDQDATAEPDSGQLANKPAAEPAAGTVAKAEAVDSDAQPDPAASTEVATTDKPAAKPVPGAPEKDGATPTPPSDDKAHADEAETADGEAPSQTQSTEELEAAAAAQAEHDAAIQKMVDSKQYFLPINAIEQRRTKRFVVLGVVLSLLLAVAWVDIALDASLIQLGGIKPATHFFSN